MSISSSILRRLARVYSCTQQKIVPKVVRCAQCGGEFLYLMTCVGKGHAVCPIFGDEEAAELRADRRATVRLDGQVQHGCEPVACPDCGTYQPNMVALLRRERGRGLRIAGLIGVVAHIVLVAPAVWWWYALAPEAFLSAFRFPWLAVMLVSAGLYALGWLVRVGYHPVGEPRPVSVPLPAGSYGPFRSGEFERKREEMQATQERWGGDALDLALATDFGKGK